MARIATLALVTAMAGFLVGVRATGGTVPAFATPETTELREVDPLGGGFWRPAGSNAVRPVVELEAKTWEPTR